MNRLPRALYVRLGRIGTVLVFACTLALAACSPPAVNTGDFNPEGSSRVIAMSATQPTAAPAQPTAAPAATSAPRNQSGAAQPTPGSGGLSTVQDFDRKIIKNANLTVVVESADTAIFRFTGIVKDVGGYIVSNRVYSDNNQKGATMVVAVPVDRFEESLNLFRQVPKEIVQDFISSSDVTDEFIDLEARLKNLDATALRIRELLAKADKVEDALKINIELSNIESQIEQIKGRLNGLNARTSYSTISIDMREPLPSPTPNPTATPVGWRPDETVARAVQTQNSLIRVLGDSAIFIGIVLLPYLIGVAILVWLIRWFVQRNRRTTTPRA